MKARMTQEAGSAEKPDTAEKPDAAEADADQPKVRKSGKKAAKKTQQPEER